MASNKIVKQEKGKRKVLFITDELNEILPIDLSGAILGGFFTVVSIAYVLIKLYAPKDWFLFLIALVGGITFILMFVAFFIAAYLRRKRKAKEHIELEKETLIKQLIFCKECSNRKINDGFAYRKLLKEENLEDVETKMALDLDPKKCQIYVYTSDLATLIRRYKIIEDNIEQSHIKYRVIYYSDTSSEYHDKLFKLIGEENLLDARKVDELKNSKDAELFKFNDVELIIFIDSANYIQGFLSIDNVPVNAIANGRSNHFNGCLKENRCNYGARYDENIVKDPFYKSLNKERVRSIAEQLNSLFKGGNR